MHSHKFCLLWLKAKVFQELWHHLNELKERVIAVMNLFYFSSFQLQNINHLHVIYWILISDPTYRWFPSHERAIAVGICMGGFHLRNVVGLVLTPLVMSSIGISGPFVLYSSLGLFWLTTWSYRVANDPQNSSTIRKAELRLIQAGKSDSSTTNGVSTSIMMTSMLMGSKIQYCESLNRKRNILLATKNKDPT